MAASCLSNNKQLISAQMLYANDNQEYVTPLNLGPTWALRINKKWWENLLAESYIPVKNWLDEINGKALSGPFYCPLIVNNTAAGCGIGIYAEGPAHYLAYYGWSIRLHRHRSPSNAIFMGDSTQYNSAGVMQGSHTFKCYCMYNKWTTPNDGNYNMLPRHVGRTNAAFLDGHAASFGYKELVSDTNDFFGHVKYNTGY